MIDNNINICNNIFNLSYKLDLQISHDPSFLSLITIGEGCCQQRALKQKRDNSIGDSHDKLFYISNISEKPGYAITR